MTPRRGRRRTIRIAVAVLVGLALVAVARVGPESVPARALVGTPVAEIRSSLAAVEAEADRLANLVEDLRIEVHEIGVAVPASDPEADRALTVKRRAFEAGRAQADLAASDEDLSRLVGVPSLAELSRPLGIVGRAIHSGDDLLAAILARRTELQDAERVVGELLARVRRSRFTAEATQRQLTDTIAAVTQARGGDDARTEEDASIRALRTRQQELQLAEIQLRGLEGELRSILTEVVEERTRLAGQLGTAQGAVEELHAQMTVVEELVASRLAGLGGLAQASRVPMVVGTFRVCPVDEPRWYTDDFGAPRFSGGYHPHQGNDIFAPEGTPIRAPFAGTAVEAANTLGGLAVVVYGRDGYVYNAHLTGYGTLGRVQAGDVIGFVGNTGNAQSTAPHDHFEWHPGGGPAVSPYAFLNAVC